MEIKERLIKVADCFYQEKNEEGMQDFMQCAASIGQVPAFSVFIDPLFDALEQEDYILAADILQHEMAERL